MARTTKQPSPGKHRLSSFFIAAVLGVATMGGAYGVSRNPDTFLTIAARMDAAPAVAPLVWMGANVRRENLDDDVLWRAAIRGHTNTVKALLDNGADIHVGGEWALLSAVEYGHSETVRLLLDRGADIHARNERALFTASYHGFKDMVQLLLDRGANIHANHDDPLRMAAYRGHTDTVRLLLQLGANPHALNGEALELALQEGHMETAKLLRSAMEKNAVNATPAPLLQGRPAY